MTTIEQTEFGKRLFENRRYIVEVNSRYRFELKTFDSVEGVLGLYTSKTSSDKKISLTLDTLFMKSFKVYIEYLTHNTVYLVGEHQDSMFIACSLLQFGVSIPNSLNYALKFEPSIDNEEDKLKTFVASVYEVLSFTTAESITIFNTKNDGAVFRKCVLNNKNADVVRIISEWLGVAQPTLLIKTPTKPQHPRSNSTSLISSLPNLLSKSDELRTRSANDRKSSSCKNSPKEKERKVDKDRKTFGFIKDIVSLGGSLTFGNSSKSEDYRATDDKQKVPSPHYENDTDSFQTCLNSAKAVSSDSYSNLTITELEENNKEYTLTDTQLKGIVGLQSQARGFITRKTFSVDKMQMRNSAITELYDTEVSLLKKMELMEKHFMKPMMAVGIDKKVIKKIFVTLPQCIESSRIFVRNLEKVCASKLHAESCVGNVLGRVIQYITPYLAFTTDYNIAEKTWKEESKSAMMRKVIQMAAKCEELENTPLNVLLIQPIQRIMRYPMLIKEVLKFTPQSHPDYFWLKDALKKYEYFCTLSNERSKMRDALMEQASELEMDNLFVDNRYLIWAGFTTDKHKTKILVFNDSVVVAQKTVKSFLDPIASLGHNEKNQKWSIIDSIAIDKDINIATNGKVLQIKKYGRNQPLMAELQSEEITQEVYKKISGAIEMGWFDIEDTTSWADCLQL
ncbi:Rho/RAC guanine nucleotide exchange factor, putative [Entamoeba invadens IP1]|uniref:Rho/RAC guanine nucleotide exchange factor, putative n=1 Tax=Entamoeba invadens IP1 TaxID=370355 RepID=A0A0A1UC31_ENTIV|nr:Rho/RAC guanine nucleotide exchange factor, putative [Entamoeba invadens IP1]ELP92795.1 Rho/RAC guanine nucleotide exchange factor, putative [Entamoeba invadens IP1]|eukprot:XP_004259566.1 Rho/RAC guanine nucleotide exchange factor, putative [Entamoeba invadens IP1]